MRAISDPNRDLTRRQKKSFRVGILPSLLILFVFENIGCSSAKPPNGILSQAELDVRAASEARADRPSRRWIYKAPETSSRRLNRRWPPKNTTTRAGSPKPLELEASSRRPRPKRKLPRRTADDLRRRLDPFRSESERATGCHHPGLHQGVGYEAQCISRSQVLGAALSYRWRFYRWVAAP